MSVETLKLISLAAILATGLAGGFMSLFLAASRHSKRLFGFGNTFSGGIFLGAGLLHMLPDAAEDLGRLGLQSDFPWASMICAAGIVLVLFVEHVLLGSVHSHHHAHDDEGHNVSASPYLVTVILSIHSLIAGIALGGESTVGTAFVILAAILAHKGSAAFAIGVSLNRGAVSRTRSIRLLVLFAFMTPLGVLLGQVLAETMSTQPALIFETIFNSLAAGTFIYVATLEVIGEEFAHGKNRWQKFILFGAGLGLMSALAAIL